MISKDPITRILLGAYVIAILAMSYFYWNGSDNYITWKITAHAEQAEYPALSFEKGPFELSVPGSMFTISESFSAGPIERHFTLDAVLLIVTWLGLCIILTNATYLSRTWFTGVAALFIFLLIRLELTEVGIFGFQYAQKMWGNAILILAFIGPAYLFQSYLKYLHFGIRLLSLIAVSVLVILFSGLDAITFQEQLTVGLHFSMIVVMLLFLLVVSEENVFGILYLITKSRGSNGNEKHFPIFSLFYIGFLGLAYAKKSGLIRMDLPFFDPYVLLIISSLVAVWSLRHKKNLFDNILTEEQANILLFGVGLSVFGYLSLAFSRGNDPIFEGYHYFILYAHLGFGAFFFFYVIANFINPLSQGLQVYKIAYHEQNVPYVTARIGGVIAVAAFFLMADQEAFKLFRAGHFNYVGAQQEQQGEQSLAERYYQEGSVYGFDNHFSNYKVGYLNLQRGKIKEANYKFGRATLRYPTTASYVNQSSTFGMLGEVTPSLVALQDGLKRFPGSNPMLNNVGLIYTDLGNLDKAASYFEQANESGEWSQANLMNIWKIGAGDDAEESYQKGNAGVKANVLLSMMGSDVSPEIKFEEDLVAYPLHKGAYLINSVGYFGTGETIEELEAFLSAPQNEEIYEAGMNALAIGKYRLGYVNNAIKQLDQMAYQANEDAQAAYYNVMGLMCLREQSPELAIEFLNKSLSVDSSLYGVNMAVALFENRKFDEGLDLLNELSESNENLKPLIEELTNTFSLDRGELSESQAALRAYYLYEEYSLAELNLILNEKSDGYISGLWNKMIREQGTPENIETIKGYLSLFQPLISEDKFYEGVALVDLVEGQTHAGASMLAQIMSAQDSVKAEGLYQLAGRNALNVGFVLAVSDYLMKIDTHKGYDLLVNTIDIQKTNIPLLKAYTLAAVEVNLSDYAGPIVNRLKELMDENAYRAFMSNYNEKLAESSAADPW